MKIEEAIQQKEFSNAYLKANINLLYTAAWMQLRITQALKRFNISHQQFNLLRILRGQHPKPASIRELTDRMLDKSSNASRLVDKLFAKNLVTKEMCENDNRRLEVMITDEGLELLKNASYDVEMLIDESFGALSKQEAAALSDLLDKLRES